MIDYIEFYNLSHRANAIFKSLGARRAAGFLRNRNVCLEDALAMLGMPARRFPSAS